MLRNRVAELGLLLGMIAAATGGVGACVGDLPPPSSTSDGGGSGTALCDQYCQAVVANCKDSNSQYASFAECQEMCALLPVGVDGVKENSVHCRLAQARAASSKEGCAAAGPFGGDVCGTRCQAFCSLVEGNCGTQTPPPYASEATCKEECALFHFDPSQPEGPNLPLDGDTLNCRGQHLRLSLHDKPTHCPHTRTVSSTCNAIADAGH